MADDPKLGIVQSQVVSGIVPREEGPKLGVVLPDAPVAVVTPPGLGVVRRELILTAAPTNVPAGLTIREVEWSRIYALKRAWIASQGQPGSDQVLRDVVNEVYSLLNLPRPAIYRFQSPLGAMLAVRHLAYLHGTEVDHHYTPLAQMEGPISSYLGPIDVTKRRNDEFCRELTLALREPIASQLNARFLDRFTDQITAAIGSLDTSRRLFDSIPTTVMSWWSTIAESRCWWWPYSRFLVVADDPVVYHDEDGREHRADGPAVEFSDGYALYYYHGWKVPERVILRPESLTVDEIDGEKNAEIRRIMIECFGHGNYLQKSGARVVDLDTLTLDGSAPRALLVDRLGNKWMVGTDGSTARVYTMPVRQRATSCKEAHEGISGFDESRLIAEA